MQPRPRAQLSPSGSGASGGERPQHPPTRSPQDPVLPSVPHPGASPHPPARPLGPDPTRGASGRTLALTHLPPVSARTVLLSFQSFNFACSPLPPAPLGRVLTCAECGALPAAAAASEAASNAMLVPLAPARRALLSRVRFCSFSAFSVIPVVPAIHSGVLGSPCPASPTLATCPAPHRPGQCPPPSSRASSSWACVATGTPSTGGRRQCVAVLGPPRSRSVGEGVAVREDCECVRVWPCVCP